jgi:hypothetical protein
MSYTAKDLPTDSRRKALYEPHNHMADGRRGGDLAARFSHDSQPIPSL